MLSFFDFQLLINIILLILQIGEIIEYHSLDSTVGFVYNRITSSGT